MNRYECNFCKKIFSQKQSLNKHIVNRVCIGKKYNIDETNYINNCIFCNKTFTTSTSMYRHVNHTCKIKKSEDLYRDKIYIRLLELESKNQKMDLIEKENLKLKKEITELKKISKKVLNINNGIVNNITLIGYGKEDLSRIDKKEILKAIQCGYDSALKLTETFHFNPKHPEYHNIYITNVKDKYAMMFDGKDWNLTMKDDLINKIYDDQKNYIEENIDEFIDSLSVSRRKALERWLDTDDDDDRICKIKNEIKLLLFNKRNVILDHQ